MILWTDVYGVIFSSVFFFNLALIRSNYKPIYCGGVGLKDRRLNLKKKKTCWELVNLKSLGKIFIVVYILYKL
jgi:hypothetical protein